jgi:hypothetical protein
MKVLLMLYEGTLKALRRRYYGIRKMSSKIFKSLALAFEELSKHALFVFKNKSLRNIFLE